MHVNNYGVPHNCAVYFIKFFLDPYIILRTFSYELTSDCEISKTKCYINFQGTVYIVYFNFQFLGRKLSYKICKLQSNMHFLS